MKNRKRLHERIEPDLDGEELADQRQEDHFFTVPHLLGINLNPSPEFPPLPAVLHKDLERTGLG